MPQAAPSIATAQQCFAYLGITAAQAAAQLADGVTTLSQYIQAGLDRAAVMIVEELSYDYTTAQFQIIKFMGNGEITIRLPYPINTISLFKSYDARTNTIVDEGAVNINAVSIDPYVIVRTDLKIFQRNLEYVINCIQLADPLTGGWPLAIQQIQLEIVALWFRESSNQAGSIGRLEYPGEAGGRPLKYMPMLQTWKARLRPWRRLAA